MLQAHLPAVVPARKPASGLALGLLAALFVSAGAAAVEKDRTGGPYVPTPQIVVDEMLRVGKVGPADFVVDLGSGDGVIVLTAAQQHKARGYGVDIDPELVRQSNDRAKHRGLADRASFHVQDVFQADLSKASVVTLYLLPDMMAKLQSKLFNELRPGARIVSHDYQFYAWEPDDSVSFDVPEKEAVTGIARAAVHLWIVPAKVAGRWELAIEGRQAVKGSLLLQQRYQAVGGEAVIGGRGGRIERATLRGEEVAFWVMTPSGRKVFTGRVNGRRMEGDVELPGAQGRARWRALRADL